MTSTMHASKMLVGTTTALLVLALVAPAAQAEQSLARTTDGGCVLVEWGSPNTVVAPASGCTAAHPCVVVDSSTIPPTATLGEGCP